MNPHPLIHDRVIGSGPSICVLAGLTQTVANWKSIARQNHDLTWLLFDPRGQGKSQVGPRPYSIDDHVDDLLACLDKHEVERTALLGFSHGGRIALRAASRLGDRLSALVLVSTAAITTIRRKATIRSWAECLELGGVEALAWASLPQIVGTKILHKFEDISFLIQGTKSRNTKEGLQAMFEGMRTYPIVSEDASKVRQPTLVMRGREDNLISEKDDILFRKWMPQCQIEVFDACGHTLPLEESERFGAVLRSFLKAHHAV